MEGDAGMTGRGKTERASENIHGQTGGMAREKKMNEGGLI